MDVAIGVKEQPELVQEPKLGRPVVVTVRTRDAGSEIEKLWDVWRFTVRLLAEVEKTGVSVTVTEKVRVVQLGSPSHIYASIEKLPTSAVA